MIDFLKEIFSFSWQGIIYVIDILLVAYLNYRLFKLIRGTRAWRIVTGIFVFVAALWLSDYLGLNTLHWVLDKATMLAPVALVILFLPELRQAVEGFGKLGVWTERLIATENVTQKTSLDEIVRAVDDMADSRIGALIVVERGTHLGDIADNGVMMHAKVTAPLLGSVFFHGNPLHDGAVLVRGDEVVAAACRLPLSESRGIAEHYHMRHRAGIGMSEQSDAVVLIVSEERGEVSVAMDGKLEVMDSSEELSELLARECGEEAPTKRRKRSKRKRAKAMAAAREENGLEDDEE